MSTDLDYASRKLGDFVDCLTLMPGRIAERMLGGFKSLMPVQAKDFVGTPFATEYEDIIKTATSKADTTGLGTLHATITAMSEEEAVELARRIVDLKHDIDKHLAGAAAR